MAGALSFDVSGLIKFKAEASYNHVEISYQIWLLRNRITRHLLELSPSGRFWGGQLEPEDIGVILAEHRFYFHEDIQYHEIPGTRFWNHFEGALELVPGGRGWLVPIFSD